VLTGSVARDEATVVRENQGLMCVSDADVFVILADHSPPPSHAEEKEVARAVASLLKAKGISIKIGVAAVDETFLRSMPTHIEVYELRECGVVLWGDSNILSLIPAFDASRISREDAWRLICNRMVECLEAIALANGDESSPDVFYKMVKLNLDMATSYLVFAEQYAPTYNARARRLKVLAEENAWAPMPLGAFADIVAICTAYKIGRGAAVTPNVSWQDTVCLVRQLWRWELSLLSGVTDELSDHELLATWMTQQPLKAKLRGWASVMRRSRLIDNCLQAPRWFRFASPIKGSPRYWIYSVAASLYFRFPLLTLTGDQVEARYWDILASRLPLRTDLNTGRAPDDYLSTARLVALNYRQFLETTTA